MRPIALVVPVVVIVGSMWISAGCAKYEVPPSPPSASTAPTPQPSSPAAQPGTQPSAPVVPAVPAAGSSAAKPSSSAADTIVKLSAAVALPQTSPEGTVMMFSVDYAVHGPLPPDASQCRLTIGRAQGSPAAWKAELQQKGTLERMAPTWRPEEGPFQMTIVDSAGRPISNQVTVTATGQ